MSFHNSRRKDMHAKSHYISELAHLFLCSYDEHINTCEFMSSLAGILSTKENQGESNHFNIYLCMKYV